MQELINTYVQITSKYKRGEYELHFESINKNSTIMKTTFYCRLKEMSVLNKLASFQVINNNALFLNVTQCTSLTVQQGLLLHVTVRPKWSRYARLSSPSLLVYAITYGGRMTS
jgi:hypothetical protein